jgi:hypothetical protein
MSNATKVYSLSGKGFAPAKVYLLLGKQVAPRSANGRRRRARAGWSYRGVESTQSVSTSLSSIWRADPPSYQVNYSQIYGAFLT